MIYEVRFEFKNRAFESKKYEREIAAKDILLLRGVVRENAPSLKTCLYSIT
jgi:hypothetical protein